MSFNDGGRGTDEVSQELWAPYLTIRVYSMEIELINNLEINAALLAFL